MEYTVRQLANLSGVSTRTLRYYDAIGLLPAKRRQENDYRFYGTEQVDRLQQILFYRELGVALEAIPSMLAGGKADRFAVLEHHLGALRGERERLGRLIETVEKTLLTLKGEAKMTDEEKFEGFKRELLKENEEKYGKELREKYGEDAIVGANEKLVKADRKGWQRQETLSAEIAELLGRAVKTGNPSCADAQKACDLHRQWLCLSWKEGTYSRAAHRSLAESYVGDSRFRDYYDAIAPGCAIFFRDALEIYCTQTDEK